jgi:hypothetical protein
MAETWSHRWYIEKGGAEREKKKEEITNLRIYVKASDDCRIFVFNNCHSYLHHLNTPDSSTTLQVREKTKEKQVETLKK